MATSKSRANDARKAMTRANTYHLDFTTEQWEELTALTFEPFEFAEGDALTRGQWLACAHMALGKAQRVESGDYGDPNEEEDLGSAAWAAELREIAGVILAFFRPGDGQI